MTERCQCYKSKQETTIQCPHKAKPGSKYCGFHKTCVVQNIRWTTMTTVPQLTQHPSRQQQQRIERQKQQRIERQKQQRIERQKQQRIERQQRIEKGKYIIPKLSTTSRPRAPRFISKPQIGQIPKITKRQQTPMIPQQQIPIKSPMRQMIQLSERANCDLLTELLSKIELGADINIKDEKTNSTALMCATKCNLPLVVEYLIKKGADTTIKDMYGYTVLHRSAMMDENPGPLILSLDSKAINIQDKFMRTPLHIAIQNGNDQMFDALLKHNADLNIQNILKQTPLKLAIKYENKRMIAALRSKTTH